MKTTRTPGPTHLQRLIASFDSSLSALGADTTPAQVERLSVLVHECMSGHGRHFHDVVHALQISAGADPIQTLAALFHDTIYYQIDDGFTERARDQLKDAIATAEGGLALTEFGDDEPRAVVGAIFGFAAGKVLTPYGGLNEFLSALLAVRALATMLPLPVLAEIAACIEATIPFRGAVGDSGSPAEALYSRMCAASVSFALDLSPEAVARSVTRAVDVANRDVGNFAFDDPAQFLDNTWQLLPETNRSLRGQAIYTIREWRGAMAKMLGFFDRLDPGVVFNQFRGYPAPVEFARMNERARANVEVGRRYLRVKLVTAWVLEALAALTGGDAPISLFMGDLPSDEQPSLRLEDVLPSAPPARADDVTDEVLVLLAEGRASETGFDIKHAPLAALLYQALGDAGIAAALESRAGLAEGDATDEGAARAWLSTLPRDCLAVVIDGCCVLAVTRTAQLTALRDELAQP